MYEGQQFILKVKEVLPSNAWKQVTWETSNKDIATVSTAGKVTAKKRRNNDYCRS